MPVPQAAPPAGLPSNPQHDLALAVSGLDPPVGHRRIYQVQHLVHHRPQRPSATAAARDPQHLLRWAHQHAMQGEVAIHRPTASTAITTW
jgi:hypothetical protein